MSGEIAPTPATINAAASTAPAARLTRLIVRLPSPSTRARAVRPASRLRPQVKLGAWIPRCVDLINHEVVKIGPSPPPIVGFGRR